MLWTQERCVCTCFRSCVRTRVWWTWKRRASWPGIARSTSVKPFSISAACHAGGGRLPDMRRRFALSALPIGNIAQNQKQKVDHAETPAGKRRWIAHVHTCCVPQRKIQKRVQTVQTVYKPSYKPLGKRVQTIQTVNFKELFRLLLRISRFVQFVHVFQTVCRTVCTWFVQFVHGLQCSCIRSP